MPLSNQNSGPVLCLLCTQTPFVVGKKYPGQEPAAASLHYGSGDLVLLDPWVTQVQLPAADDSCRSTKLKLATPAFFQESTEEEH